jgi:hypothetical protein
MPVSITAAAAARLNPADITDPVVIDDLLSNIVQYLDALQTLASSGKLASITLTDTTAQNAQLAAPVVAADSNALAAITNSDFTITPSGTVTAAQAATIAPALAPKLTTGVAVSDTAAALSNSINALQPVVGSIATVTVTDGNPLTLTAAQLIADTAVLEKNTGDYKITVTGTVTADQAVGLAPDLLLKLTTGLTVADTAANVIADLANLQTRSPWIATIALSGAPTVLSLTAEQVVDDATALGKLTGTYSVTVSGALSVAQYSTISVALSQHITGSIAITDTAANVAAAIAALQSHNASIGAITLTDTAPVLSLTAAQVIADAATLLKIASAYTITVTGQPTAAQAAAINTTLIGKLGAGITVSDTAAAVAANLAALQARVRGIGSIVLTDTNPPALSLTAAQLVADASALLKITSPYHITVTGNATAAQAAGANATLTARLTAGMTVVDTGSNVVAALNALQTHINTVASITLSDSNPALTLTGTQLIADAAALAKITSPYTISISGTLTAAQAASIRNTLLSKVVGALSVSDSADNVSAAINSLVGHQAQIGSITLTDTAPLTLTPTQLVNDASLLAKITNPTYQISLASGATATATEAVSIRANLLARLNTGLTVADTAANIATALPGLQSRAASIAAITLTDTNPVLSITADQLVNDSAALLKITNSYQIDVAPPATAAQAASARNALLAHLSGALTVSDTAANVAANLAGLQNHAASIHSIALTDSAVLLITADQLSSDAAALAEVAPSVSFVVTDSLSAAAALAVQANPLASRIVGGIAVADSAANIAANLDSLQAAGALIGGLTVTDGNPIAVTGNQLINDATVLQRLTGNAALAVPGPITAPQAVSIAPALRSKITGSLTVTDSTANVTANLTGLQTIIGKIAAINLSDQTAAVFSISSTTLVNDAATLGKINSPFTLTLTNAISIGQLAATPSALITHLAPVTVTDSASDISAALDTLHQLGTKVASIQIASPSPATITLTNAQLVSDADVLAKINTSYSLSLNDPSTVAQALAIPSGTLSTINPGVSITDTASNIQQHLDDLEAMAAHVQSIAVSDAPTSITLSGNQLAADAVLLGKISPLHLTLSGPVSVSQLMGATPALLNAFSAPVTVNDSDAAIQANLDSLQARISSIAAITLNDPPASIAITASTLLADAAVLAKINGPYSLTISSGTLTAAQLLSLGSTVTANIASQVSLADSAANIQSHLDALEGLAGKIQSIALTDQTAPTISLTNATLASDTPVLKKINAGYSLSLSDPSTVAQALAIDPVLIGTIAGGVTITDTAQSISAQLDNLQNALAHIASITVSDAPNPISLTAGQLLDDGGALLAIVSRHLSITGTITAAQLANANLSLVDALAPAAVSDSAAAIQTDLDTLQNRIGAVGSISLSDQSTPTIGVSAATLLTDAGVLAKIGSDYNLNVSSGTMTAGDLLSLDPSITSHLTTGGIALADNAASIDAHLDALHTNIASVGSVTVTSGTVTVTAQQLATDADILRKIVAGGATLAADTENTSPASAAVGLTTNAPPFTGRLLFSDSAANVAQNIAALQALSQANELGGITLTDGGTPTLALTAAQLADDGGAVAAINGAYTLSVAGAPVTAAQAITLATHYAGHFTNQLQISDSGANIASNIDQLQSILSAINGIGFTDTTNPPDLALTAAQVAADNAVLAKVVNGNAYTVAVSGTFTAAQAAALAGSPVAAHLDIGATIQDTAAAVAGQLDTLQTLASQNALGSITLTDSGTPTLTITPTQLGTDVAVLRKIAGNYTIATTIPLSADQAANISSVLLSKISPTTDVNDSATKVLNDLDQLEALAAAGHLRHIILSDSGSPVLHITADQLSSDSAALNDIVTQHQLAISGGITAAQAQTLASNAGNLSGSVNIVDSAANITNVLANMAPLAGMVHSVTFTDSNPPTLSLTATQFINGAPVLAKVIGSYTATVSGALTVQQLQDAVTDGRFAHVTGAIAINDTAASVQGGIDLLQAQNAQISAITLSDSAPSLVLTAQQVIADATLLGKIATPPAYTISVTGSMSYGQLAALPSGVQDSLRSLAIQDTAQNIGQHINDLNAIAAHIVSIAATDQPNPIPITVSQFLNDADALGRVLGVNGGSVTLTNAASATDAVAISHTGNFALVTGVVNVSDSAANVVAYLGDLENIASAGHLGTIVLPEPTPALNISSAQLANDAGALAKIQGGDYVLNVTGSIDAVTLAGVPTGVVSHVSSTTPLAVTDNAADIVASLDGLKDRMGAIGSIAFTDSPASISISTATLIRDAGIVEMLPSVSITVTGTMTIAQLSNLNLPPNILSELSGINIVDSSADVAAGLDTLHGWGSAIATVTFTDPSPMPVLSVTLADANADAVTLGKIQSAFQIAQPGDVTAATVAGSQTIVGDAIAGGFLVNDTAANVQTNLAGLATFASRGDVTSISLTDGSTQTITVAGSDLATDAPALAKIVSAYDLSVSSPTTVAALAHVSAQVLQNLTGTLAVSDTTAHVAAALAQLVTVNAALTSSATLAITLGDSGTITLPAMPDADTIAVLQAIGSPFTLDITGMLTAAQALSLNTSLPNALGTGSLHISDSAADISSTIDTLNGLGGRLATITLNDATPAPLSITGTQFANDTTVLTNITTPGWKINLISGVTADQAVALQNSAFLGDLNAPMNVADTAANVQNDLATLEAEKNVHHIGTITLSGANRSFTLSGTTLLATMDALGAIDGGFTIAVSDAMTVDQVGSVASSLWPHIQNLEVADNAADVVANLTVLQSVHASIGSIHLSDNTPEIDISKALLLANSAVLAEIDNPTLTIGVTDQSPTFTAGEATSLTSPVYTRLAHGLVIQDNVANVQDDLGQLHTMVAHIGSITLTNPDTAITLSAVQAETDQDALAKIGQFGLDLTGPITAADVHALENDGLESHLSRPLNLTDSTANLLSHLSDLHQFILDGKLGTVALTTPSTPVVVSGDAATTDADAINAILAASNAGPHTLYIDATTGGHTVNTTPFAGVSDIALGTNTATMAFSNGPPATATIDTNATDAGQVTLGSGNNILEYTTGSGVQIVSGFQFGLDTLNLTLASGTLQATDVIYGNVLSIELTDSNSATKGLLLLGTGVTASDLMTNHASTFGTHTIIT